MMLCVEFDRLGSVIGHEDPIPLALEPRADGFRDRFFVVDHQHGLFAHGGIVVVRCGGRTQVVLRNRVALRRNDACV